MLAVRRDAAASTLKTKGFQSAEFTGFLFSDQGGSNDTCSQFELFILASLKTTRQFQTEERKHSGRALNLSVKPGKEGRSAKECSQDTINAID